MEKKLEKIGSSQDLLARVGDDNVMIARRNNVLIMSFWVLFSLIPPVILLSLPALPRRSFIQASFMQTCLLSTSTLDLNRSSSPIVLPLTYQPLLEAYTLNFSLEGSSQNFTGVVDTGSPFLTVAAPHRAANPNDGEICGSSYFPFGCYRGEGEVDPELGDTVEQVRLIYVISQEQ
jgi:hypothetical protein